MDMSLIDGTFTGLKAVAEIAKGLVELKSITDVKAKAIELQSAILAAQSSALSANADLARAVAEMQALKDELARIKAWDEQKQRYRLVSPWSGAVAYALREAAKGSDPPHWICTKCFEDGRRSILNPQMDKEHWFSYVCPVCKASIRTGSRSASQAEYAPD